LAVCAFFLSTFSFGATPDSAVKAVLLFHLAQFVHWPASAEADVFQIGILGPDPFGAALDEAVKDEKIEGHAIVVKRSNNAADLRDCRIVYVSPVGPESLPQIQATLKGRGILLVGEDENFLRGGGMIIFTRTQNRKIRLEIDLDNVRSETLKVSAELLRVCTVKGGHK